MQDTNHNEKKVKKHKSSMSPKTKEVLRKIFFVICVVVFIVSVSQIIIKFYKDYDTQKKYIELQPTIKPIVDYDPTLPEKPEAFELVDAGDVNNSYSMYNKPSEFDAGDSLDVNGKAINSYHDTNLDINDEVVGYIRIPDTQINYPVLQTYADNEYYLERDIFKRLGSGGSNPASIFLDYRNRVYGNDKNTIIYGHNMKAGTMFATLHDYRNWGFAKEHNIIYYDTLYENMEWKVFASYKTHVNFNYIRTDFKSDAEYQQLIDEILEKSDHDYGVVPTVNDRILTLSTCARSVEEDYRVVVQAVLVKSTPN